MILQAKNLVKSFQNGEKVLSVLDNISIDIYQEDCVTIVGESGAGKSTLLNILGTLDSPTSGILTLNNEDINVNTDTFGQMVGPPIYEGMISGYYFGKAG